MSDIREFYDADAVSYDEKRFGEDSWETNVHQNILLDFLSNIHEQSRVLEVGCGTGRFTKTLVKQEFETTAVDLSEAMIRETLRRCHSLDGQNPPSVLNADVNNIALDDDSFDVCIMINVTSHLPNPEVSFQEIARVVRTGGHIFTNFPILTSPYFPIGLIVNMRNKSVQEDVYAHWYSWNELKRIFSNANLEVKQTWGHLIPPNGKYIFVNALFRFLDSHIRDGPLRLMAGGRFYHLVS